MKSKLWGSAKLKVGSWISIEISILIECELQTLGVYQVRHVMPNLGTNILNIDSVNRWIPGQTCVHRPYLFCNVNKNVMHTCLWMPRYKWYPSPVTNTCDSHIYDIMGQQ